MNKDQRDLFSKCESLEEVRIEAAKEILKRAGYRIIDPVIVDGSITNKRKLRDYFYMRLDSKYPNRQRRRVPNIKYDMQIIGRFVESQMNGVSEQSAIQSCVAIINTLFDYEEEFRFKYPVTDIGILGQGKMSWITEKAIELLNKKNYAIIESESNKKADAIENSYEIDADEITHNLDALLEKMEANNGEEKERN